MLLFVGSTPKTRNYNTDYVCKIVMLLYLHGLTTSTEWRTFRILIHLSIKIMKTLTATQARKELYRLLNEASETHEPIQITGKRANAVLISEDDWRSIQETLYLSSIPGMQESIVEGLKTPVEDTDEELDW